MRFFSIHVLVLLAGLPLAYGRDSAVADGWLTNSPKLPERFQGTQVGTNFFSALEAEVIGGQFRVRCSTPSAFDLQ